MVAYHLIHNEMFVIVLHSFIAFLNIAIVCTPTIIDACKPLQKSQIQIVVFSNIVLFVYQFYSKRRIDMT